MKKNKFFPVIISVGLILFPVLIKAQPVDGSKFLKYIPVTTDSGISSISKKNLQKLGTIPATAGQLLLLVGQSHVAKQASILWLAKKWNRNIYRVEFSQVISKYIGETEKNLDAVFEDARVKGNILFFDEGDELFGKRTSVSDSHDKYANQEVSWLLSRIEKFEGIAVLASNTKQNIDAAFLRRIRFIIETD